MLSFSDLIVGPTETLRTAMERMTRIRRGVLFVCDRDAHLAGILSDGDVRRTLLDNTLLACPVEQAMNTDPVTAHTREEAAELLGRQALVAVPVVNAEGRILEAVVEGKNGGFEVLRNPEDLAQSRTGPEVDTGALAIIPARGGSQRIPRKNLAVVAGKSLLARAVETALAARLVDRVLVSTDDPEIADAARACGADVPWLRPEQLARGDSTAAEVVVHALEWAVSALAPGPQWAVLLEPTAPLRTPHHVDAALSLLARGAADCVMSVSEIPHVFNPEELLVIENGALRPLLAARSMAGRRLRGEQAPAYVANGLVYALRVSSVLRNKQLFGAETVPLVTPWEDFLDVDTPEDLRWADYRIQSRAPE